jgi:branched-chain amino acid transport system permease protein
MSAPAATAPTSAPAPAPAPARRLRVPGHLAWPIGYLAAAIVIFVFYYLISMGYLTSVQGWAERWIPITTVNQSLVWAMCALGLNIVVGYAGLLDLGYVAFWAIGSYVAGWLMSSFFFHLKINWFGNAPAFSPQGIHINFWVVLIAAAVVAAVAGIIIGAPTLRLRSDYLALVTLGFGEIIPQFFHNADKQTIGVNISNGTQGISPVDKVSGPTFNPNGGIGWGPLGPFDGLSRYIFLIVLTALIVFVSLRLRVGRLGRAWLAIREDELAAGAMGVPLMRTKLAAYAVGAVAGGIAGVAYSVEIAGVSPDSFDFSKSIILLAMVVLGGMGNVWGVILGAIVIFWFNQTGLPQGGNAINSALHTNINFPSYNFLIFGVLLVLMMLFKREGFVPEARTKLLLREPGRTEVESLGGDLEQLSPELEEVTAHSGDDAADAPDSAERSSP